MRLVEISPEKRKEIKELGYDSISKDNNLNERDVVILALPDTILGKVSENVVPNMKENSIILTLDPAVAYANLLSKKDGVTSVVAHPCHPSVFGEYFTKKEHNDEFGGIAAEQDVVAALHEGTQDKFETAKRIISLMYAPVGKVHETSLRGLAILEPTLTEVIVCMLADFLDETLKETTKEGVPENAARAMMYGHINIALNNSLLGANPFSDACYKAMDYGRNAIIKEDWKRVFDDEVLNKVVGKMLELNKPVKPNK